MLKRLNILVLILFVVGQTIIGPIGYSAEVGDSGVGDNPDDTSIVDKSALEDLLVEIADAGYSEDDYTKDSFAQFVAVWNTGKDVYADNEATEEDVNETVDAIEHAIGELQKKEPKNGDGSGSDGAVSGEGTTDPKTNKEDDQGLSLFATQQSYENMTEDQIKEVTFSPEPDMNGKTYVENGDKASFRFNLKDLHGSHPYGPGSTLTIPLPEVFKNFQAGETTLVGDIEFDGQHVIFTFNDEVLGPGGIGAATEDIYFEFTATIDNGAGGLEEKVTIPGYGELDLSFTPAGGKPVKKEQGQAKDSNGNKVSKNPDYFEWTVIVNTDLNATNGEFKDTLQPGHTFKQGDEVTVTELTMKANGTYDERTSQKRAPDSSSDNEITLNLDTNKAYKITYKTYPEDPGNGGKITYENSASFGGKSDGSSVTTDFDTGIKKQITNRPSGSDLTTDWEITVNENKRDLGNITVTDKWTTSGGSQGAKQELVDIKIFNEENQDVTTQFNINHDATNYEQGFNVVFNNIGTNTYVIKYTTKPTTDTYIQENMTVNNNVSRSDNETTFKDSKRVTYNKTSFMLNKTTPAINYAEKRIDWKIVANQAKEELENPVFEDRFTNKNMMLKQDTLKVQVGNKELEDNEFTLEVLDNQEGFNIKIAGTVNEQVTITYTTDYDIRDYGSNTNVYKNDVTLKSENNVPDISDSAEHRSEQKPEQRDNGKKSGVYNYETKRFEWEVELNFNYNTLQNAVFEDVISNDPKQTIDLESIKVFDGAISQGGDFQRGNQVEPKKVEVNGNTLKVELGQISTPHKITYESYVTGDFIPEQNPDKLTVTNKATLKDGDKDNANWTKTVGVNYTDKLINKTGQQLKDAQNRNTAGIKWSFEFNYAQSDLKNIVITDDVGKDADGNPNQLYNEDSFKVFPVTLSGTSDKDNFNAATVANDPLNPGEYELDVDVKNGTFTLKLPDGDSAYFVVYETVYLGAGNEKVKNQVAVQFENEDAGETSAQGQYSFTNFTYSGGGNVIRVPFVVIKTDAATGQPMEDIEFTLYHKESDRALMSDKTDKDGILDFGINFSESDYYLKEENLPDDYVDLGNIEFKLHRDSTEEDGKYQGMQMVNVENIQTEHEGKMCENFAVTVLDVDGEPDKIKKVKLVNKTTSKEYKETTNSDGKIVKPREDLPAGEYEVYEVIEVEGVEKHVRIGDITVKYVGEDDLQCNASVQPEVTTISGTKTWLDNDSEERPDSIGINVYRQIEGGVKEKIDTITVYENNNWEFSKKYRALDFDGNEYTYRIEEITPTGYESNVTGNFEDGFTITNTRTGKTEVSVTKVWKDNNNATGDRPNYIKVNLIRDNIVIDTVDVTANTGWTYTWDNLDMYNDEGVEYEYTVSEHDVEGYSTEVNGFEITNTRSEVKSITINKGWKDDNDATGDRPNEIEVELFRSVEGDAQPTLVDKYTIQAENDWTLTIGNLSVFDEDGIAYAYKIEEKSIDGYEAKIDGFDITNVRTGTTEVSGTKTWEKDEEGNRPEYITVNLLQNGETVLSKEVTAQDNWEYTFTDLPEFDDEGVAYVYTVEEGAVDGYKTTYEGYNITNTKLCEKFTVEVKDHEGKLITEEEYTFESEDGQKITKSTDKDGKIAFDRGELPAGKYTVKDKDGNKVGEIEVVYEVDCADNVRTVTLEKPEDPKTCEEIELTIKENGKPSKNKKYTLSSKDGKVKVTITTDKDGKVIIDRDKLSNGKYIVINADGNVVGEVEVKDDCYIELNIKTGIIGKVLPNTATQMFSYIALGLALTALGLTIIFTRRSKQRI